MYYVNSGFNAVANNASGVPAAGGHAGWWWEVDVVCISAGPDQLIETDFNAKGSSNYGTHGSKSDDYIHVISGSGR